jgi:formylglycine-generating enzyme required for sulfatase activity
VILSTNLSLAVPDPGAAGAGRRFYRLRVTGGPPPNPNPDELVWIPPGTFTLGSPSNELDRYWNEGPQTRVTLSRGFWMAKFPVTQVQYFNVVGANPSLYEGADLPVDSVNRERSAPTDTYLNAGFRVVLAPPLL